MATITQAPYDRMPAGNLPDIIISTEQEVRFRLYKGQELLLDEKYIPDGEDKVTIDIRDVVSASLSLAIPTTDTYEQTGACGNFSIYLDNDGSAAATFLALLGGIEGGLSEDLGYFRYDLWLNANFLTWQAQDRDVSSAQPEWLTIFTRGDEALYGRCYNRDGTTKTFTIDTFPIQSRANKVFSVNCTFQRLWALGSTTVGGTEKERWGVIDIWRGSIDNSDLKRSYIQRYCYRPSRDLDETYLCENSLGGIDTFRFTGDRSFVPELEHTTAAHDGTTLAAVTDALRKWSQNTGHLGADISRNLWDLLRSRHAYHLRNGVITPIAITSSELKESSVETDNTCTFEYRYAADDGLQNLPRTTDPASVPEIPGP